MADRVLPARRLVLAAILGVAVLAAACSDSDTGTTGTSQAPTSGPDVTAAGVTSTTLPASSTTVSTTTAPSTTAAPSTTLPPAPRPDGLVLLGDGLGPLAFGADPSVAVEFLSAALGTPMADSGWTDSFSVYGTCPGSEVRGVEWPGFLALFGDADDEYASGRRHFMAWTVGWFGPDPFGMRTEAGVGIGTSRDDVAAAYLAATFNPADGNFPPSVSIPTDRGDLWGTFGDDAALQSLTAGTACGE
jgi:hypothetical protein